MSESDLNPGRAEAILALLESAGYPGGRASSLSPSENLAFGLAWLIAGIDARYDALLFDPDLNLRDKSEAGEIIEAALKSMDCPYPFQSQQIQDLDHQALYPVVQWVADRFLSMLAELGPHEVSSNVHKIAKEEHNACQLQKKLCCTRDSMKKVQADLNDLDQKKADVLGEILQLHDQINKEGASPVLQKLTPLLELLQELEQKESQFLSYCEQKHSDLEAEISELERRISRIDGTESCLNDYDQHLTDSIEKLNLLKKDLASKLRAILLLNRQLDEVPSPSDLIQYEHRFSELYVQIQEKHQKTRKYYATYNALLEIKELMLKEISLLNSINSQFQDAIMQTVSRTKLIDSMEGILKGTQQKLEKVQVGLIAEYKTCDTLKQKYAAVLAEQQLCSSLIKALQEEYVRSERLWSLSSMYRH